jgi:hypothetical protein
MGESAVNVTDHKNQSGAEQKQKRSTPFRRCDNAPAVASDALPLTNMKPLKLLICLVLAGLTILRVAASAEVNLRSDINPALEYYQAFLLAPEVTESEMDYLASNNLWSTSLPKHFGEIVGRYDAEFRILRPTIGSTVPCDWGLDMSAGPAILLPHLSRCKAVMVGTRYRVAWDLQQGRQPDACNDLIAAFTLARNVSRDGSLISVLVQIAAESIGCDIIAENYGKFSNEALQRLVQGIDSAPSRGTAAASIGFEKSAFHDWLTRKIQEARAQSPNDEAKVMKQVRLLVIGMEGPEAGEGNVPRDNVWEQLSKAGGETSEGIVRALNEERAAYDQLATIMALPYAEFDAAARSFSAELPASQYPLFAESLPACLKARQREFRVQVWLAMVHTALNYRLHGEPGLLMVNDPCAKGPFAFQRFLFEGVDRGFQLKSAYQGTGFQETMIFVEKPGTPFFLAGPHAGEPRELPRKQK